MKRRTFLCSSGAAAAQPARNPPAAGRKPVDFRYAPPQGQATFCFPDDPHKSLVGEHADLRLGYDRRRKINHFPFIVEFSLRGMESDRVVWQKLESPVVPIIRTRMERAEALIEITTFASKAKGEGRVDNVLMEIRPKKPGRLLASPMVRLRTRRPAQVNSGPDSASVTVEGVSGAFMLADCPLRGSDQGDGYIYTAPEQYAAESAPLSRFFRFPMEGQSAESLTAGLRKPLELLEDCRTFWRGWQPFQDGVEWHLPATYQSFLTACTRNILQARERVDGKLTFQVGPTTYRGLWVVDGNFILEAANYLGYGSEARQGLETTWGMQREDGSVVAAVETAHWKDTGIAMFTMVRQAELSRDWSYFVRMKPNILRGVDFLASMRRQAEKEGSANGRYGLLAKGFGDGGIGGGLRDEFTNTLWALAGLRAVTGAARAQKLEGFQPAFQLYESLRKAFLEAVRQQMRKHPVGFDFLPMLLKEDPAWDHRDPLQRPSFQNGQWAMAQAIYPGLVFERSHPAVHGYVELMRSCTREDVPIETGWLPHDGLWNYDACFAAHACLWAGAREYALDTFRGFLNHATPLYCWREEQPLRHALTGSYVGDMPHNWASAECVLFLRHMLALEDGSTLRLLDGIDEAEMASREMFSIANSPTRFGRISLTLEPAQGGEWRMRFERGDGPAPGGVTLPEPLGRMTLADLKGAGFNRKRGAIQVDPSSTRWEARWKS